MLFTGPLDVKDSDRDGSDFAALTAPAEDAPRSTTSACSWSFARKSRVRDMAAVRSAGGLWIPAVVILKPWASLSAVDPVLSCRGAGQRAKAGEELKRSANRVVTFHDIVNYCARLLGGGVKAVTLLHIFAYKLRNRLSLAVRRRPSIESHATGITSDEEAPPVSMDYVWTMYAHCMLKCLNFGCLQ